MARSVDQLIGFNFPLQIGHPKFVGGKGLDGTNTCAFVSLPIRAGDVCILASDGVFDNLFDQDLVNVVTSETPPPIDASSGDIVQDWAAEVSHNVIRVAREAAEGLTRPTPFSKSAKAHNMQYQGGKMDDITAVVAVAVEGEAPDDLFGPPGGLCSGNVFLEGTVQRRTTSRFLGFVEQPNALLSS